MSDAGFYSLKATAPGNKPYEFEQLKGDPSRASQKAFWNRVFADYWEEFPWYVPIDKDPDPELWEEPVGVEDEEVMAAKGQIISQTQLVSIRGVAKLVSFTDYMYYRGFRGTSGITAIRTP